MKAVLPSLSPHLSFFVSHPSFARHLALLLHLIHGSVNSCTECHYWKCMHALINNRLYNVRQGSNSSSSSVKCHHAPLNMTLTQQPRCYRLIVTSEANYWIDFVLFFLALPFFCPSCGLSHWTLLFFILIKDAADRRYRSIVDSSLYPWNIISVCTLKPSLT